MAGRAGRKTAAREQTTAQRLDSIIKSARRIMRKDKGLNGDLDRLPMLTWIMFLKFLDDMERIEETKAALAGTDYRAVIDPPYRWRDWAAPLSGLTGPDLLAFLEGEEAERPDGSRGPGLFAWLKNLRGDGGGRERRDVVATVFQGFSNRMESGYLLRDVVNLVDGIRFHVSEEVHTLGRLYETLLREMRDAAGDAGEFYTPRPVVRFMVEVTDPRLGETVLDPACGTGGFLTESFDHLMRQAKTETDGATVQERSVFGEEAKTLPYLLAQLNLLLHGLHAPRIDPGNALRHRLTEIGEDRRVNVILTNPPFGGEEEAGILNNFPDDRRTAETALLFPPGHHATAQARRPGPGGGRRPQRHPVRRRHRRAHQGRPPGELRPAHDRPLAGRRLRALHRHPGQSDLLRHLRADTLDLVLRATPAGGTQEVLEDGPAHLRGVRALPRLMDGSGGNERAWQVDAGELVRRDDAGRVTACNLDLKNPYSEDAEDHRSPAEIVDAIIAKERRVLEIMDEIKATLAEPI